MKHFPNLHENLGLKTFSLFGKSRISQEYGWGSRRLCLDELGIEESDRCEDSPVAIGRIWEFSFVFDCFGGLEEDVKLEIHKPGQNS